jgi:urea transport system ATP-binding protein
VSALLALSGVEADIGGSRILRGVSLEVAGGEVVCLMGRNGVGKTTTLRCIMGLRAVRAGSLSLGGKPLGGMATALRAFAGIGYVPQGRDIFPHLTVEENLRVGILLHPRPRAAARDDLERVYALFPVLKSMLARKGGVLSGGQQQQLAIARAMVADPKLIILDEPTEGIQPSIIKDIERVIRMLRERGDIAIVLCEQYYDFARALADQFVVLSRGSVVRAGERVEMDGDEVRELLSV